LPRMSSPGPGPGSKWPWILTFIGKIKGFLWFVLPPGLPKSSSWSRTGTHTLRPRVGPLLRYQESRGRRETLRNTPRHSGFADPLRAPVPSPTEPPRIRYRIKIHTSEAGRKETERYTARQKKNPRRTASTEQLVRSSKLSAGSSAGPARRSKVALLTFPGILSP
jgi:hypothetical protein